MRVELGGGLFLLAANHCLAQQAAYSCGDDDADEVDQFGGVEAVVALYVNRVVVNDVLVVANAVNGGQVLRRQQLDNNRQVGIVALSSVPEGGEAGHHASGLFVIAYGVDVLNKVLLFLATVNLHHKGDTVLLKQVAHEV